MVQRRIEAIIFGIQYRPGLGFRLVAEQEFQKVGPMYIFALGNGHFSYDVQCDQRGRRLDYE